MIGHLARRRLTGTEAGLAVGVISALVQLGPVLGRGYVLTRDLVFLPRPPLDAHLLGVDTLPRAVPSDLLVALLSRLLPGDVIEDLVLFAIIAGAGWGAARLAVRFADGSDATAGKAGPLVVAVSAAAMYSWNPYLAERLRQGQWAVLLGYAALPWIASAALALYAGEPRAGRRLLLAVAVAATGGASAELLAIPVAVPIACWPGGVASIRRRVAVVTGSFVVLALPWAVPALTSPSTYPADKTGVLAFAARADTPFGTVGSLFSLGGIWNAQVSLPGRDSALVGAVALAVTAASLWALLRMRPPGARRGLVLAGAISLALAVWAAVPGLRRLAVDLGSVAPAGGLLRDGQRWLAPFVLLIAVGFGCFVEWARSRVRLAPVLALAPILLLPAAGWGSDGAFVAVHWPPAWSAATSASRELPPGPVLVLPWASQRIYTWNGGRVLTDPAANWLPRRVVGDDALVVGDRTTALEDPLARSVAAAATGTGPLLPSLRRLGYGGVLVERDQAGASAAAARLRGLQPVVTSPTLELYAVPGFGPGTGRSSPDTAPVPLALAALALAGLAVLGCAASLVQNRTRTGASV